MGRLSQRVNAISGSPTLKLVQLKNQLTEKGLKIIDFGAGEPDFPTPENIKQAGISAIQANFTKYTPTAGISELKCIICSRYRDEQGYEPAENEIVVSPGSKFGLFILLQVLVNPGDEVIVPLPFWVSYPEMVRYCGGVVVYADHLNKKHPFELTADSYIKQHTPKTKVVLVNSPSNPTGKIMKADELKKLIAFCRSKNVFFIVDDCYRKIIYTSQPYPSPLQLAPEAKDLIAVVSSLSKSYSMTGWRVGYTIAPAEIGAAMVKIQEHSTSNPCSISQKAAVEALKGPDDEVVKMVREYQKRRDFFARRIDEIGHITYSLPDGAFYFFADFSFYIKKKKLKDDSELTMDILNRLNIILVPGSAFGVPNHLRISYATSLDDITAGLKLLESYLKNG